MLCMVCAKNGGCTSAPVSWSLFILYLPFAALLFSFLNFSVSLLPGSLANILIVLTLVRTIILGLLRTKDPVLMLPLKLCTNME